MTWNEHIFTDIFFGALWIVGLRIQDSGVLNINNNDVILSYSLPFLWLAVMKEIQFLKG